MACACLEQAVRAVHVRRLRGKCPVHQRAHGHLQRPAQPLHASLLIRRIATALRAASHVALAGHACDAIQVSGMPSTLTLPYDSQNSGSTAPMFGHW